MTHDMTAEDIYTALRDRIERLAPGYIIEIAIDAEGSLYTSDHIQRSGGYVIWDEGYTVIGCASCDSLDDIEEDDGTMCEGLEEYTVSLYDDNGQLSDDCYAVGYYEVGGDRYTVVNGEW